MKSCINKIMLAMLINRIEKLVTTRRCRVVFKRNYLLCVYRYTFILLKLLQKFLSTYQQLSEYHIYLTHKI